MKLKLILISILVSHNLFAQNIYSALHLNRQVEARGNKAIKEISETNTFYNATSTEIKRNKKTINAYFLVAAEERFDGNGKLEAKLTRQFDPTGTKITSTKFERWLRGTYTVEISSYSYNEKGHLTEIIKQDADGKTLFYAKILNNDNGHPIQLESFDGNGNSYGIEVAEYDYAKNEALTKVLDRNGKQLSTNTITIDFKKMVEFPRNGDEFNELGDLMSSEKYSYKRKYDNYGNWTLTTIYKKVDGKLKKNRRFKRKITYSP